MMSSDDTDLNSHGNTDRSALLVIDMQLVAFDGLITEPVNNAAALLKNVATLIATCRQNKIPILFVQTCARAGQPYSREAHGWQIHPDLGQRKADITVFKTSSSGFQQTGLKATLDAHNIRQILVCGIWSQHCVANTCRDAIQLGYATTLISDAHGTVADSDKAAQEIISAQNTLLRDAGLTVISHHQLQESGMI